MKPFLRPSNGVDGRVAPAVCDPPVLEPPAEIRHRAVSVGAADGLPSLTKVTVAGIILAGALALIGGLPVDIPMPSHRIGWVTPTCGLTRGSTAIARGDLALAWRYNPASFLVMALGIAGAIRALVGFRWGRWLNVVVDPGKVTWACFVVAAAGLWMYQQQQAEFIIHSRL